MSFLKIFKGNKEEKKEKTAEKARVLAEKKGETQAVSSDQNILRPHVTEKATQLAKSNQYVFRISPSATKNEVKNSIKKLYRVDVQKVRIVRVPSKRVRIGRFEGHKSGYKKAIVTIAKGQKIEIVAR